MNSALFADTIDSERANAVVFERTTLPLELLAQTSPRRTERLSREMPGTLETQAGETYRLTEKIGEGGLGIVYRAVRDSDNLLVAIKLPAIADAMSENSLRREGQLLSLLQHPNIIKLLDRGESVEGEPFIALEHLQGQTLEQALCQHGPLSLDQAARISLDIAEALNHAHSLGTVHCDLKPANIFIDDKLNVKVLDFGISASVNESVRTYKYGSLLYMSPEQIKDQPSTVQSDIYQLALLFFRTYFDRLPFDCSSMDTILSYRRHPRIVCWSGAKASKSLRRLLKKAMSQNPTERPCSMNEFMQALRTAAFATPCLTNQD